MNARRFACALPVDQDGKALAEVKYIQAQYLGGGAFQLTGEDGVMETVKIEQK